MTGGSLKLVLENLRRLSSSGKPLWIRVPLVLGVNYRSWMELRKLAELASSLESVERVDLLSYHALGALKYRMLGREYRVKAIRLTRRELDAISKLMQEHGLKASIGGLS